MSTHTSSEQWADELFAAFRVSPRGQGACPEQVRILKRAFAKTRPGFLLKAMLRLRARQRRIARREIKDRLRDLVQAAMVRYRAASAWLYIPGPGDCLRALVTCNANHLDSRIAMSDNASVVARVARLRQADRLDDVRACPYYKGSLAETVSELAVPVLTPGESPRLLGVLNLESDRPAHFPRGSARSLQKEVGALVAPLLCREATSPGSSFTWPWHTGEGGWDLYKALNAICRAVAAAVHDDRASCAVWHADWDKQTLFTLGSSGLHAHFVNRGTLPLSKSVTGKACRLPAGQWIQTTPDDPELCDRTARDMRMSEMFTTPVYAPAARQGEPPVGAVNIYLYQKVAPEVPRLQEQAASVAAAVGEMLSGHASLREAAACADLHHRLEMSEFSVYDYATIRDAVERWLNGDGCSVFLHDKAARKLLCMATTGVVVKGKAQEVVVHSTSREHDTSIDLATNKGILAYLARNPDLVVRLHKTKDEPGADYIHHPAPVFGGYWDYDIPTEYRRFLGISVAHEGETFAVIRVPRRIDRPPFTRADEALLRKMAEVWMTRLAEYQRVLRQKADADKEIERMYIDLGGGD